jgi:hypothetical protein
MMVVLPPNMGVQVPDVAAKQLCPAAEVVGPKVVLDEVTWLTQLDVRLDMTEEERELWELGGQDDEVGEAKRENEVEEEESKDAQDAGWICKRRLDYMRGFGHADFNQNHCWARREEVSYGWKHSTSKKLT